MSAQYISKEVRQRVAETARFRCGYCLTSQHIIGPLLEIDHLVPEARGGASDEANLWLACPICNGAKSDRIQAIDPTSGDLVRLFNPREDIWADHFVWTSEGTVIEGKNAVGRATVVALNMNHPDIVTARVLWVGAGWHPPLD